jgi:hypothetical protein
MATNTAGLRPFTADDPERARAMGARGNAARKARDLARRVTAQDAAELLHSLAGSLSREDVPAIAWAAVLSCIARVETGAQVVRDPDAWIRALADVARAAAGEPDQTSIVAHLTGEALAERVRELQAAAGRDALPAAVLAADDEQVGPPA